MNDDEIIHLTLVKKRTGASETFMDKTYTRVIEKAFSYMKRELRSN